MKQMVTSLIGMFGSAVTVLFGGWDIALQTLLIFMVIDWITGGILLQVIFKKSPKSENGRLESRAGWKGLCRKGTTLLFVLIAVRLDLLMGTNYLRDAVCIAFIANEALSILENAGLMGMPIPEVLRQAIDILNCFQLPRYQNLKGITEPGRYLETIWADGYATSSVYVQKNMELIEQYQLTKYDENVSGRRAQDVLDVMSSWLGYSEANGKFRQIIDLYNSHQPLARGYAVQYTDEWCDTAVSAAAIQADCVDLIGTECGCEKHIEIFKEKGIWIEDGTIVPLPGDIILYNWDFQVQPNDGYSDHIGYVESVSGQMITVIEGNYNEAVARRKIPADWGQIRGYARPKYAEGVTGQPSKSIEEVAGEVIQGKYANGKERRKKLCDMGYDPNAVQREVNRQLSQNEAPAEYYVVQENDTLSEIAKRFATTYLELAAWNGIADPNMIYVGQKIRIR